MLLSISIVPLPVLKVIPLLVPSVKLADVFKVPPFKIMLSASAEPGVAPKPVAAPIEIVPSSIVVIPL